MCAGRVVVKAPADRMPVIACGGQTTAPAGDAAAGGGAIDPELQGGMLLGERYEAEGLESLCTAAGQGTLTCDGTPMAVKSAKPLPASD